jgi:DNA/RNA-binding domain of Phe-tRNA-synthetase-like protein
MMNITIHERLKVACPNLALCIITCKIKNSSFNETLWKTIAQESALIRVNYTTETLKLQPEIEATRQAYRSTGKDPSRYRPSAEALCRRILRNMELYRISTAVDLINLFSIKTGFSIGGFDADKIQGDIEAGIGTDDEPYEAIERRQLNIVGLPVLRDRLSAFGTPTSDATRTAITMNTSKLLLNFNAFRGKNTFESLFDYLTSLLKMYLCATQIEMKIVL